MPAIIALTSLRLKFSAVKQPSLTSNASYGEIALLTSKTERCVEQKFVKLYILLNETLPVKKIRYYVNAM